MAWKKEKKKREKAAEGGAVRTHYPLWDNYREALGCLVAEIGGKSLWVMGGDILLAVLCPFAAMALPSAVVYLLGKRMGTWNDFPGPGGLCDGSAGSESAAGISECNIL